MKTRYLSLLLLGLMAVSLSGCAQWLSPESKVEKLYLHKRAELNATAHAPSTYDYLSDMNVTADAKDPERTVERLPTFGDHTVPEHIDMKTKSTPGSLKFSGDKVQLSFENMPINDYIVYMMSDVFKKPYVVDEKLKRLKATVTMDMPEAQTKKELFNTFKSILALHKIDVENKNGIFLVRQKSGKKKKAVAVDKLGYGRTMPPDWFDDRSVAMFAPMEFVEARKIVKVLKNLNLEAIKYETVNKYLLLISGNPAEVKEALDFIQMIDKPSLRKKTPYLVPLKFMDPEMFVTRMRTIFKSEGIPVTDDANNPGLILQPIKEIGSVYVLSPKQEWIDMLLFWKAKLDILEENNEMPKLFTYQVDKRKAEDLAEAINNIIGGKSVELAADNTKTAGKQTAKATNDTPTSQKSKVTKRLQTRVSGGGIRFVADPHTNTISVRATRAEYMQVLPLIKKLDTLPKQVIIEVVLAEVTLTDDFQFGFEWFLEKENYSIGTLDGLGIGGSGLSGLLISGDFLAKINAYSSKKLLDIISKPRLVVLNNGTGTINVGSQIPIITSESSANDLGNGLGNPSILRNVSYRNTGVIVNVSPTVNSQGVLTMEVDLSLSEAQTNNTSGIDSPLIVERSLTTSAVLKSGETIFLGGLIASNTSNTDDGVPYIQRLPIINWFFSSKSDKTTKTELIMLITPTIVTSSEIIVEETEKFHALLKSIQAYHEE
jgi:general secretion pathway protein D